MLSTTGFDILKQIAHGIAQQFGSNCEVVVHSINCRELKSSIVFIENGHVSNRRLGNGPSHIVLEALKKDPRELPDKLNYLTKSHDGRILKSSTIFIRDDKDTLSAILAINYDITGFLAAQGSINSLIATESPDDKSSEPESIPLNVNELLDELLQQSIRIVGKPTALMTKDDKIKAIEFLNSSGAFLITKSGDKISKAFNISKYTLYNYINAANNK